MKMFAKTIRSASAFLLVAALFLGVCSSPIALAMADSGSLNKDIVVPDVNGDGKINYVSLGDSMTNGYCLPGYYVNNDDGDADNALGYRVVAPGTYPALFAEYLSGVYGKDVEHDQLAVSGMRIEELHFLLDESYEGDIFTWLWFDARNNGINDSNSPYYFKDPYHEGWANGSIESAIEKFGDLDQDVDGTCRWARILLDENGKNINVAYDIFEDYDWALWHNRMPSAFRVFAQKTGYKYNADEMNAFFASEDLAYIKSVSESKDAPLYALNANEWIRWDYQNSVENADVISMSFGSNNFGHFVKQNINVLLNIGGAEFDMKRNGYDLEAILAKTGMTELYNEFRGDAEAILLGSMGVDAATLPAESKEMLNDVLDIMSYALMTYLYSFTGSVNAIREMNPEAQLVFCGMINDMAGIELSLPGFTNAQGESIVLPGGDVYALLVDTVNTFMAAFDAKYTAGIGSDAMQPVKGDYPEAIIAPMPDTVEMVIDQYAQLKPHGLIYQDGLGTSAGHTDPVRHYECSDHMADWLLTYYLLHKLEDGYNHNVSGLKDNFDGTWFDANANDSDKVEVLTENLLYVLLNCNTGDQYRAKGIVWPALRAMWQNQTTEHVHMTGTTNYYGWDDMGNETCLYMNVNGEQICFTELLVELVRGIRNAVIEGAKHTNHDFDSINSTVDTVVGKCLVNNLSSVVEQYFNGEFENDQFGFADAVTELLVNDEEASSYLYWYARMLAGNGSGVHPTLGGHKDMYNCLKTSWEDNYTSTDYLDDQSGDKLVELYNLLKDDTVLNNEAKVDLMEKLYRVIREQAKLGDYPEVAVAEEIYTYLVVNNYTNDDKTIAIVLYAYERILDEKLSDAEKLEIVDFIYKTLFKADITDEDRIEIIGNVYAILDNHNYISAASAKYAEAVENIYNALTEAELLTNAQAWDIVNFVYVTVMANNGNVDTNEMRTIAIYIYDVVLNGKTGTAALARGGSGSEPTPEEKLQAIFIVYEELKASDIVNAESYPQLETLEELANELIFNDDALLTPEQSMAIIDAAFNTLVVEEKGAEEAVEELTKVVTEEVFDNPDVDPMVKLEVIDKIGSVVGELVTPEGGSGSETEDPMVNIAEYTKYIGVAKQIVANLKAEGLFDDHADEQFNALISAVLGILMKGEQVDLATLAETAFSMLFAQPGHTLEQKIRIVVVIYETLEEETDLVIFTDIDNFVEETEKLVEELKTIVLANEELVKELYANLEDMYEEVETLTAELGEKLVALDKLENEVLAGLKADRAALVAELEALEAKLEAVVNGTYGRAAVSDKEALIEDTKAAIAETKAAIAELDATIDYVVNQIKTDKSGIEAIKADIAEIKANITATENALADVIETIDQLDADIAVLADAVAVLYEVSVGQFVDEKEVIEAIVAIAETVPSMVENVKALYEQGVVAAETVEALVNVISENAEAIGTAVENLYASAEDWANVNVDKAEAIADTLNEVKAMLNTFVNENYPAAEEAVIETVNKLNVALKDYVDNDVIPLVEEYKEVALLAAAAAYLYADEKGYIEYVKELVNGYIEDAEEIVEDLKADLKDAKIELEAKRAELEAKLPGWKEDLKQLKEDLLEEADAKKQAAIEKAIAELEDEIEAAEALVEELEAFVEAVEAHIAEVEAAVEAVKAALNAVDGDVAALNAALMNLVDALADLGCSVADLGATVIGEAEKLVGYGVMIGEDIIAVIETLDVYCDLAERFAEVLKNELIENKLEVLEYLAEVLKDACEYLVDAIYDAIVEYLPELDAALYDYFYNHPEEVINFVKTYGPYLLPIIEEYGDEALAIIGYVLYMYGEDMAVYVIENHEAILAGFVNWVDKYGERTAAMLQVYAETLGLCDAVRDQIAELEAELEKLEAELEKVTGEAKEAIEAKIAEVKAAIAELEAKLAAVIEALNEAAEDVNAKVEDLIADIEDAIDDLEAALEDLEKAVEDLINETLKAIRDEIFEGNRIVLEKILGIAEDILNKNIETLEELVAALDEAAIEAAKEIKAIIDELVYDATHGEYVIENDSFYVALGDSSAVSQSYVDALAAVLGVDYENLAQAGHTATDTLALIAEKAELLAKADLVTVGYTANIFTAEVVYTINDIMMGNEVVEYDWAALVTEDGVEYVEKALAEVHAKLVEQGMDVDFQGRNLADMLVACVEAYAYRYVEHILTYPEIVNAVHNVAPEALVVIVGLHNTVENIVIDVEGTEVALGEYVQYAVDAANVVSLVNAILVEDTVFVATPDVETLKEEKGDALNYDMVGFVWEVLFTNGADFATSANGHAYIAEQILNALTVIDNRTGLLGDADGDGDVDSTDAMLVLQYDALLIDKDQLNLVVCDVDGDGDVDSTDAMYILQYDGLLIEVFPVEE